MLKFKFIFVLLSYVRLSKCDMEPFVVGGQKAPIEKFPHSAFLRVLCKTDEYPEYSPYVCGASILNNKIVLTAAHCLFGCRAKSNISIAVGNSNKEKGRISSCSGYLINEGYKDGLSPHDIGLVALTTPLRLGKDVKRVALMSDPPYYEKAQIAGWGAIQESPYKRGDELMYIDQWVWRRTACLQMLKSVPIGHFCASSGDDESYASVGDSGSALVVRNYIQIGIVSYKVPKVSRSLVVYTDTGFYYDWILRYSKRLYCSNPDRKTV